MAPACMTYLFGLAPYFPPYGTRTLFSLFPHRPSLQSLPLRLDQLGPENRFLFRAR